MNIETNMLAILLSAIVSAIAAWFISGMVARKKAIRIIDEEVEKAVNHEKELSRIQHEADLRLIEEIKKSRQDALDKQIDTSKAEENFKAITLALGRDFEAMKKAFEESKIKSSEDTATMKEKFDNAVKQMAEQSMAIGAKADNLADAMRGQKKMQGCWGETVLYNLLSAEGLVEGRDFHREQTLRDANGNIIHNEETEKKMRPDYILHFIDGKDVVIDSKVSLAAYIDYQKAATPQEKEDAARRNLEAILQQVKILSSKDYSKYIKDRRSMVDYVIMFVPNYPALQLAYQSDDALWRKAYEQKVLITSEETLIPFLRMITLAWRNVEQVRNQQEIVKAAQTMLERVADFAEHMAKVGEKLNAARDEYDKAARKIKEGGQSISTSARQVVELGVPKPSKKALPEPDDAAEFLPEGSQAI